MLVLVMVLDEISEVSIVIIVVLRGLLNNILYIWCRCRRGCRCRTYGMVLYHNIMMMYLHKRTIPAPHYKNTLHRNIRKQQGGTGSSYRKQSNAIYGRVWTRADSSVITGGGKDIVTFSSARGRWWGLADSRRCNFDRHWCCLTQLLSVALTD